MNPPLFYKLFLDDERNPRHVVWITGHHPGPWVVVRNYWEFTTYVERHGLPAYVSFDHDLADEHYRKSMYAPDKHYTNYYTDGTFKEKTGYECAKWLVNYCVEHGYEFPPYQVHSMNPIGRENIICLIESFKKNGVEKRSAYEWAAHHNITIYDPDGWRVDETPLETPITEADFHKRIGTSTIGPRVKNDKTRSN